MRSPDLDELIRRARQDRPEPAALAAVGRRLGVSLAALPMTAAPLERFAGSALSPAPAKRLRRGARLGLGVGSAVLVSGLVAAFWSGGPVRAPAEDGKAPPVAQRAPAQPSAPLLVELPPEPPVVVAPPPEPRAPRATDAPASSGWDEPRLIERARRALASEPRFALSLAQEHERRFPKGALGVEREVISIEALSRSGQPAEARRRALAFEARFPTSIHVPRVRALRGRLTRSD